MNLGCLFFVHIGKYFYISFFCREVPGTDVSSAVETDKENVSMESDEDNNTTNKLLDSTYDMSLQAPAVKLNFSAGSPSPGSRSPLKPLFTVIGTGRSSADMFAVESDTDATPSNKHGGGSFFASPQF